MCVVMGNNTDHLAICRLQKSYMGAPSEGVLLPVAAFIDLLVKEQTTRGQSPHHKLEEAGLETSPALIGRQALIGRAEGALGTEPLLDTAPADLVPLTRHGPGHSQWGL